MDREYNACIASALLEKSRFPGEIAALFPGANAIKVLLMNMVCGMKSVGIPAADRVWFTERMFDMMSAAETGDIFCRDGSHRLLTPRASAGPRR